MGLTFAKSVKFGVLRFNFSGSGIGVSGGIPGLRVGVGPRGAYIAGGAFGFRYRQNLPLRAGGARTVVASQGYGDAPTYQSDAQQDNISGTATHDNVCVLALNDCSDNALLQTLNEQRSKSAHWPFGAGLIVSLALVIFSGANIPLWVTSPLLAGSMALTTWLYFRDQAKRVTALFFELDEKAAESFEQLQRVVAKMATTRKLLSIEETSAYRNTKYSAGASQGLKLHKSTVSIGQAPFVASNVDVPLMSTGKTTIAFYPDRALLFQGGRVGAVEYSELTLEAFNQRFIEVESVPADAKVVDRTWKYVNKKGGPDRRFKDNKEIPVCLYNKMLISSSSGLDLRFMGSREDTFSMLPKAVNDLKQTSSKNDGFK